MPRKKKSDEESTSAKAAATNAQPAESPAPETSNVSTKGKKKPVDPATINPQQFSSGREVAAAIAKQYDLAVVGGRLLSGNTEQKGASVSLRMFETTMEYLYGKPPSQPREEAAPRPRIIWDMPAPARELIEIEGDLP